MNFRRNKQTDDWRDVPDWNHNWGHLGPPPSYKWVCLQCAYYTAGTGRQSCIQYCPNDMTELVNLTRSSEAQSQLRVDRNI
jgi:hypothetical protein